LTVNIRRPVKGVNAQEGLEFSLQRPKILVPKVLVDEPEKAGENTEIAEIETTEAYHKEYYEEWHLPGNIRLEVHINDSIFQWLDNTHHGLKISKEELVEKALAHFLPDYFKPDTMRQNS